MGCEKWTAVYIYIIFKITLQILTDWISVFLIHLPSPCLFTHITVISSVSSFQVRPPGLDMRVLAVSGITLEQPAVKSLTTASAASRAWKTCVRPELRWDFTPSSAFDWTDLVQEELNSLTQSKICHTYAHSTLTEIWFTVSFVNNLYPLLVHYFCAPSF